MIIVQIGKSKAMRIFQSKGLNGTTSKKSTYERDQFHCRPCQGHQGLPGDPGAGGEVVLDLGPQETAIYDFIKIFKTEQDTDEKRHLIPKKTTRPRTS